MTAYDWTSHLQDGERLLWQGRPNQRFKLFLSPVDWIFVPFMGAITLIWLPMLVLGYGDPQDFGSPGEQAFARVFALLWIPIGWYFAFGRAIIDRKRRQRYRYAVTDRRVLKVDEMTDRLLGRADITPSLSIEVNRHRFRTIWLDRYKKPSGGYLEPPGVRELMMVGYAEHGLELRELENGDDIARLLRNLRDGKPVGPLS